jgi:hypothetical protein
VDIVKQTFGKVSEAQWQIIRIKLGFVWKIEDIPQVLEQSSRYGVRVYSPASA